MDRVPADGAKRSVEPFYLAIRGELRLGRKGSTNDNLDDR
jgi:hypothetical protein